MTQTRVWLRPKNSSNVVIPSAGHLVSSTSSLGTTVLITGRQIPQEAPGELGKPVRVC